MNKWSPFLYSLGCLFCLTSFIALKSQYNAIIFHDEKFTFTPHKFYIANVADGRVNRKFVAFLIKKDNQPSINVDLKNGAINAIKNFLNHNLHRDTTLSPILVTIKEFKLTETKSSKGTVSGDLKVMFSFSSQLSYQNKHLVDFNGDIHYNRPVNKPVNVEANLRRGIVDGLTYFNDWINKQSLHN